ncbi:hypothetical protein [Streptomyces sp. T12]|uniref:hypothetical protein n=1 Tax=Streptomyces sp. T12 TaxID=477697 RepID=UPI0035A2A1B5
MSGAYLDLATLYRNLVKELALTNPREGGILHVMVKGGDWVFGSLLIDEALQAVGLTRAQPGSITEYADQLLALTTTLLSDPRHFFRSYSASEVGRMMTAPAPRSVPAP